jgi:hypothetical protein
MLRKGGIRKNEALEKEREGAKWESSSPKSESERERARKKTDPYGHGQTAMLVRLSGSPCRMHAILNWSLGYLQTDFFWCIYISSVSIITSLDLLSNLWHYPFTF